MATYRAPRFPGGEHTLKLSHPELAALEAALEFALDHEDDSDAENILDAINES